MDNNYKEDESLSVTVNLAQPRYTPPPLAKSVNIVGSLNCAPYPVDLSMVVVNGSSGYDYVVSDNVSHNIIFKIKEVFFTLRGKSALLDSEGNPLVTMQRKTIFGSRWQVYKGDSTDDNDLLFSVQNSSISGSCWTNLDVFLASNKEENTCDFKIIGGYTSEKSFVVYLGHSSVKIAQMRNNSYTQNWREEWTGFNVVNVNPHVDYAFIIALNMVFNAMNYSGQGDFDSDSDSDSDDDIISSWKCD